MSLIQEALQCAKDYAVVISLVTFVLGLVVGNKQAIGRDKRKEFNEISKAAFVGLNKQLKSIALGNEGDNIDEFLLIEAYIPFYKRNNFRVHVKRYKDAIQGISTYDVETGTVSRDIIKLNHLEQCTKKVLTYLGRR
jgi:hypothetical protein